MLPQAATARRRQWRQRRYIQYTGRSPPTLYWAVPTERHLHGVNGRHNSEWIGRESKAVPRTHEVSALHGHSGYNPINQSVCPYARHTQPTLGQITAVELLYALWGSNQRLPSTCRTTRPLGGFSFITDFSINGLRAEKTLLSQLTEPNTIQN